MIGTLYRYPHPIDSTRFVYVGQGSNRDESHRAGRTSFGRRFKKIYPNYTLPEPIREQIEINDQLELNYLETVWMFKYHTWRGYLDGMNLTFPGSSDYKNICSIGSSDRGRKAVESGQLFAAAIKGGIVQGNKNVESGHLANISRLVKTPEHQSKAGKIAGRNNVEKKRGIFSPHYDRGIGGRRTRELHPDLARRMGRMVACLQNNVRRGKSCICGRHLGETK